MLTPDFDAYPETPEITTAGLIDNGVRVQWGDGTSSDFQRFWLRENAPDPQTTHPVTRELSLALLDIPDDLQATDASLTPSGDLRVRWSTGETSDFHAGWLYAWSAERDRQLFALPRQQTWSNASLNDVPRFDGPAVMQAGAEFADWCNALQVYGVAILENLPASETLIEEIPSLIGPIRTTNFGYLFDVRDKADADSNAYTNMALALHADLCTREYMPGLQFLHCLENSAEGGASMLADGFAMAQTLAAEYPDDYATLTQTSLSFYNKATDTDYRYDKPMISTDADGFPTEIRFSPWLRAPQHADIDEVERSYQALRRIFRLAEDPNHHIEVMLKPGEMLGFDNRRVLHGRTGFDLTTGSRWLRGCYVEREELHSRLRIIARQARHAAVNQV